MERIPSRVAPQELIGVLLSLQLMLYGIGVFLFHRKCSYPEMFKWKGDSKMSERKIPYKIYLEESEMPKTWYNVRADMKNKPAPLLNPETLEPMTEEELSVVFCKELVEQELDNENRYIEIPQEIQDF